MSGAHPVVIQAVVGLPLRFRAQMEAAGLQGLELDLTPVGGEPVPLAAEGAGRYAADVDVTPWRAGRCDLPVWGTDAEGGRSVVHWITVSVWPRGDVAIVDDDLAAGWSYTGVGGAQDLVLSTDVPPTSGTQVAGYPVARAGFGSWTARLASEVGIETYGFNSLAFDFHPGSATGRALMLNLNSQSLQLVGRNAGDVRVDLGLREWQQVTVPLADLGLSGPLSLVQFMGGLEGTFYLDNMRLVAAPDRPHTATAVGEARDSVPTRSALARSFPNPFNSHTTIRFDLAQSAQTQVGRVLLLK